MLYYTRMITFSGQSEWSDYFPVKLPFAFLDQSHLMFAAECLSANGVPCCLHKLPPPRLCSLFPEHCSVVREKGERAALRRNNSTMRRCQALGAVRWMMIWAHCCCCFSLCWMLTHGFPWLGVDPLCGQSPGGSGGKGWVGCNEPSLDCWAVVCGSRFCVYVCMHAYICVLVRRHGSGVPFFCVPFWWISMACYSDSNHLHISDTVHKI